MRTRDSRFSSPSGLGVLLALALALAPGPARAADVALCDRCLCSGGLLDCSGKGMRALPQDASAWPTNVEDARFDGNELVHIRPLPALPKLTRLSLRRNNIQVVEDAAFANLTALQELDLGDNELTKTTLRGHTFKGQYKPPDYQPLGNLTTLLLDYNAIHSLPSDIFEHVHSVRRLSLAGNPLRLLDVPTEQAFADLPHLASLDLAFTQLAVLPERMLHSPANLVSLNLTGNLFTAVPTKALAAAHQLVELRLSQNPIQELDKDSFPANLRSLRVLELHYLVNLTKVRGGALGPLQQLETLELAHCAQLTQIHVDAFAGPPGTDGIAQYPPLKKLVLRGDSLRRLDRGLLPSWSQLAEVDLQDNLWECACEEQWMVDELEPLVNATRPDLLRNVICEFPEPMRGRRLFDLHARHLHLRCEDAYGARPDRDAMLLVGVLVGVLLAVPATVAAVLIWRRGLPWLRSGRGGFTRAHYRRAHDGPELF